MRFKRLFLNLMVLPIVGILLTACGGGGGGDADPAPQTTGTIVVWVRAASTSFGTPFTVFIGNTQVGTITETSTGSSVPTSGGGRAVVTQAAGTYNVRVQNAYGQVWLLPVQNLAVGETRTLEIDARNAGLVSFQAATGTANLPVTVVLDGGDTLGIISATAGSVACGGANALVRARPTGTYNYAAYNTSRTCFWTGTVSVSNSGSCGTPAGGVLLPACN